VGFYGLDLYSLYSSIHAVTRYLDQVDPEAARLARLRYGCLTPWEQDPALYGQAALMGRYDSCEPGVVETLVDLLKKRMDYEIRDGEHFLEAVQNARVAANAERYYRIMYYGSRDSWSRSSPSAVRIPRPWSGSTTPTSATPRRRRWGRAGRSTSASLRAASTASAPI
jgi:protein-L-isoaspartate(D-aspartate) O-methyltransferase